MARCRYGPGGGLPAVVLTALALVVPASSSGQRLVSEGETVRVFLVGRLAPVEGVLVSVGEDEWSVSDADGEVRRLSESDVSHVEVSDRRRNALKGLYIGAGIGLATGLIAQATCESNVDDPLADLLEAVACPSAAIALSFTAMGAALGAGVGALVVSRRWVPGLVVAGRPASGARFGVGWSVPLGG